MSFLSGLNDVQREAVEQFEGPSLVIAGAGSGKTRVLTCRIANMLSHGVKPWSVLSLTFTNKAAKEMKERIAQAVGEEAARALWMGTFHSLFAKILRMEAERIEFSSSFTIYDTADSRNLLRAILKELNIGEEQYKVNDVHARISMAKNNLMTPQAYAASGSIAENDARARKPRMAEIYAAYARRCKSANAMDFDDLLLYTNILFRDHPEVLDRYRSKFRYVLVDEYQDTNYAQYLIIKKLTEQHRNLCVVGDDAQSIYSFRGAKIENILNFKKDFPECKTFKLEQNYRSTQNIVNAANSVILHNENQLHKRCFSEGEEGEKVRLIPSFTDQEEGLRVVGDINARVLAEHAPFSDFAILYRTNAQSRIFEDALRRKSIPYRIYGGMSFYQRKEIKDLLAYLRLLVNHNDDEAFKRVVNYPKRGIGDTTMERIELAASQKNVSLWDGILSLTPEQADIRGGAYKKLSDFLVMIDSMAQQLERVSAYDVAYGAAQQSGMLAELRAEKTIEGIAKLENVEELLNGIKEFCDGYMEENGEQPQLAQYLENVSLLTDADKEKPEERNTVSLMTVHSAKGLEYGYVYIVGVEENLFPGQLAAMSTVELEEERRLMYVAMTRAKRKLTLSFAQTRYRWGNLVSNAPSRFIKEIAPEYLDLPVGGGERDEESYSQDPDDYGSGTPFGKPTFATKPKFRQEESAAAPKRLTKLTPRLSHSFTASSAGDITVGATVEHERFGQGVVQDMEDVGGDVKITVQFALAGKKNLLLKYAKLMVVGNG
jgi:DNA helicase-2/ATP-dependent DNA helicase PcrA